jgi:hypothetical protein
MTVIRTASFLTVQCDGNREDTTTTTYEFGGEDGFEEKGGRKFLFLDELFVNSIEFIFTGNTSEERFIFTKKVSEDRLIDDLYFFEVVDRGEEPFVKGVV